jgi:hypothetical protein
VLTYYTCLQAISCNIFSADGSELYLGECATTTAALGAAGVEQDGELRLQIHGGTRERRDGSDRDESGSE